MNGRIQLTSPPNSNHVMICLGGYSCSVFTHSHVVSCMHGAECMDMENCTTVTFQVTSELEDNKDEATLAESIYKLHVTNLCMVFLPVNFANLIEIGVISY